MLQLIDGLHIFWKYKYKFYVPRIKNLITFDDEDNHVIKTRIIIKKIT